MPVREELWVEKAHPPISHYTHGVRFGNLIFVSGCVGTDAEGNLVGNDDVAAQARQALINVRDILAAAGATLADVCKVTVYLTDIGDRPKINPVRQELFGTSRPASTLVEISRLALPGAKVEIDAIAALGEP